MIDLAPYEDFVAPHVGLLRRGHVRAFSQRITVVTILAVLFVTPWGERGAEFWRGLVYAIGLGATIGLVLAILGQVVSPTRRDWTREGRLRRIFAGDLSLVPAPPPGATHRLIGPILVDAGKDMKESIAGALYVTAHGLVFQSLIEGWQREGDLRRPRFRSIELSAVRTLVLGNGEFRPRRGWMDWSAKPKGMPLLICSSDDGVIMLQVRNRERVRRDLQECIDTLRDTTASTR